MNEIGRSKSSRELRVFDTGAEQAYDDIVLLASRVSKCRISMVCLRDSGRLWLKASVGTSASQIPRFNSFLDTTILERKPLIVGDANQDTRFNNIELEKSGIRFYAGIPLILSDGEAVGTLSVLDSEPRIQADTDIELLHVLARQIVGELERRLSIYELEESNRALEAAEIKYRELVQKSPAGIFQTDPAGKFVFVSKGWQKVAGLTMDEAINAGWENAVHPDDKEKILSEWLASDAEQRPFRCEYRLRSPEGKITWVNAESEQLNDSNGRITGYLGALQDITKLKRSEEDLRLAQSELEKNVEERTADLRSITESIPQLVWKIAPTGESLYMSPNWTELTGVPIGAARWEDIIHPEDIPIAKTAWTTCLATGSNYETEYRIKLKDGTYRWFLARGVPQLAADGKVKKWFGTCTDINAHKLAIEKAGLAEQKLSQFLTSVPMILWAADKNGVVTLSEGKGLGDLGLKPGEAVGWDLLNRQEGEADSVPYVRRALAGESCSAVTRFGDRTIETQYAPLLDTNNNPSGIVAISNDITERVKLETSLHESQKSARDLAKKLNTVLQNAPIALTEINRQGIYTYTDGKYLSTLGIKPGDLIGQSCFDQHKSSPERAEYLRRAFAGETVTAEVQNGSNWVLTTNTPLTVQDGTVTSILALSVDISERITAENLSRASESKFRKVCESKLFGMLFWDQDGTINDTNDALLKMIGYTREELKSGLLSWKNLTPPEYAELDAKAVADTLVNGYCEPYEKEFVRKDGSRIAIIISGATIKDELNTGGIAMVIDVSAKKKAEQEKSDSILSERAAIHASKTKSQFLANMSHEIRTPINGVVGMLNLLTDTPLQVEQREYVDSARASADSLLTVINDILDFSKIESGKLEFEKCDFDLVKVLHNTEKSFLYQTQMKGLKLIFDCPQSTSRYFNGDSGRLRQILNNLLSNAIKFTSKGQVVVTVRQDVTSSELRFEIKDTGMGIPTSALERMFKAFSQADSSTSRRFGGTGLGLSIAKHLVEQMNGAIGVETEENVGSTFWFTIMLESAQKPVEDLPEATETFDKLSSRPLRVLIAEDNVINQKIALRYLEKMGLRADAVANGLEAIDAIRSIPYDLVLMDCQMPEMDGLEATRLIRSSESIQQRNIPIIAMTANAIKGDRERCIESGMNDYVSKPVAQAELFGMLKKWLMRTPLSKEIIQPEIVLTPHPIVIDRSIIEEIRLLDSPGDDTLVRELVSLYLTSVPFAVTKMKAALDRFDLQTVGREAHQLKSASANLGMVEMASLTSQLEIAAVSGDRGIAEHFLIKIEGAFKDAEAELQLLQAQLHKKAA